MRRVRQALLAVAVLAAVTPHGLLGQSAASLAASADVDNTSLAIATTQDLAFGTVTPGVATTINPRTSASAAALVVQGAKNAQISITFTLPTALTVGPYSMPLAFSATSACGRRLPAQAGCTLFDPNGAFLGRIRNQNPPNNHYHVWLGGTATPGATQQGGVYHATVTMTVVYTGL